MGGVAVKTLDAAGGLQLAGHAPWFVVEGQMVVCQLDPVTSHPPEPPHIGSPFMVEGLPWFIVDGLPLCREGHLANCGHATTGRSWFQLA
jgi:uncharacterized Zn-binding protein involved in type VI secretion